jgi:4a-hydroxytetrahydrobiopterin dehydratase
MAGLLKDTEITDSLMRLSRAGRGSWSKDASGTGLVRTVEMASFRQAIQVVNRIAEIAEKIDHHPDMDIRENTVTFHCTTHSRGGVTGADVAMAREINAVVDAFRVPG